MIRFKEYSLEEVFLAIESDAPLDPPKKIKLLSDRLILFKEKGVLCVTCGVKGEIFILETHDLKINPHLNLYARNSKDELLLMTKDHIIPKAKGGLNLLENYQTMCSDCNGKKADKL